MDNTTSPLRYNTLDTDGMMISQEPYESDNFDARAHFQIEHLGVTTSNLDDFAVFGLGNQINGVVSNCVMLKARRGSSNNIQLIKVRNGNFVGGTVLATGSFTITNNTTYWIRLVCNGGHFYGYLCAGSRSYKNWGNPVLSYQWHDADYPCPVGFVSPGKGQCGIYARITPLKFKAGNLDGYSEGIPINSSASDDIHSFASFPSSGKVFFGGEYMTYGGKTGSTFFPTMNLATSTDYGGNQSQFDISQAIWRSDTGYFFNVLTNNLQSYANWLIQFSSGNELNACWKIVSNSTGSDPPFGNYVNLTSIADTGHANTNYIISGHPIYHEFSPISLPAEALYGGVTGVYGSSPIIAQIVPGLLDVGRGQNNTSAVGHTPDWCYLYEQDTFVVDNFECYDHAEDLSTQDVLMMAAQLTGDETVFTAYDAGIASLVGGGSAWGSPYILQNGGITNYHANIDIRLSAALSDNQSLGVAFRFDEYEGASLGGNGFIASFERVGSNYYAVLYDSNLGIVEKHIFPQQPTGTLELRVISCVRVAGEKGTFIALYLNKMVYTAYYEQYGPPPHGVQEAFLLARGSGSISATYTIPEFSDWREAIYLDPNSDGQGAAQMIIEERLVKTVSHSGESIEYSAYDNYGASLTTYEKVIAQDIPEQADTALVSYLHVEADNIHEYIDADLVAQDGFLLQSFSTPRLIDDMAHSAVLRQQRAAYEGADVRQLTLPADPRVEIEDKITVGYITAGSRLVMNDTDEIVNDITFSIEPAIFDMQLNLRKWKNDTVF